MTIFIRCGFFRGWTESKYINDTKLREMRAKWSNKTVTFFVTVCIIYEDKRRIYKQLSEEKLTKKKEMKPHETWQKKRVNKNSTSLLSLVQSVLEHWQLFTRRGIAHNTLKESKNIQKLRGKLYKNGVLICNSDQFSRRQSNVH